MPSYLTRHVFRRLLANEAIVHRECLRRRAYTSLADGRRKSATTQRPRATQHGQDGQRRPFFNFAMFRKKREPAEANMDPGLEKMRELEKLERLRARLPPPEQVAKAFSQFVAFRNSKRLGIEDNQALYCLQSLRYCLRCEQERKEGEGGAESIVSNKAISAAVDALRLGRDPASTTKAHVELARALYDTLETRKAKSRHKSAFVGYVQALAFSGYPQEALELTLNHQTLSGSSSVESRVSVVDAAESTEDIEGSLQESGESVQPRAIESALCLVLQGFTRYGPHAKVEEVLDVLRQRHIERPKIATVMQVYCLSRDEFGSALKWWEEITRFYSQSLLDDTSGEIRQKANAQYAHQCRQLLDWCLRNGEIEAGHRIVQQLTLSNPPKPVWDTILVWAAGTKKSVDEIDRMIGVMIQSNEAIEDRSQWRYPDIDTINELVSFAIEQEDPYMAERFIALGRERDIEPDARTFVLQMNYRLTVGDIDGALIAYKNLQAMDLSSNEDVPAVNRLIVALCSSNRHDFDTIMNVAADLSDRRVRFEPDTVATLSLLHLRRDERFDVIDLFNTHCYHFSSAERDRIRNTLFDFALDPKTSTSSSWDAYTILRDLFDEMPRTQRTELMISFFRRERADMGVHIFQNMRMHSRADTMPTVDTYVSAFMSLAKIRDLESLEVVHNQLKLDFNVNHSTYMLNALIIAYTACGKPRKALDFWDEIAVSREGPSYNSIHVALRACEKGPFGDLKAQEIWAILRKRGVELDPSLWASYVAALVGNGDNDVAFRTIDYAVEHGELEVDELVLGNLFAGGQGQLKQEEIEAWAKERYPTAWEKLEQRDVDTDLAGMRMFRIDRSVAP